MTEEEYTMHQMWIKKMKAQVMDTSEDTNLQVQFLSIIDIIEVGLMTNQVINQESCQSLRNMMKKNTMLKILYSLTGLYIPFSQLQQIHHLQFASLF